MIASYIVDQMTVLLTYPPNKTKKKKNLKKKNIKWGGGFWGDKENTTSIHTTTDTHYSHRKTKQPERRI